MNRAQSFRMFDTQSPWEQVGPGLQAQIGQDEKVNLPKESK